MAENGPTQGAERHQGSGATVWSNNGGVAADTGQSLGNVHGAGATVGFDLDGDRDLDFLAANDGEPNEVWRNS